jgi:hypothetical protein
MRCRVVRRDEIVRTEGERSSEKGSLQVVRPMREYALAFRSIWAQDL